MKTYKCEFCNETLKTDAQIMHHFFTADYCKEQENIELVEVK